MIPMALSIPCSLSEYAVITAQGKEIPSRFSGSEYLISDLAERCIFRRSCERRALLYLILCPSSFTFLSTAHTARRTIIGYMNLGRGITIIALAQIGNLNSELGARSIELLPDSFPQLKASIKIVDPNEDENQSMSVLSNSKNLRTSTKSEEAG